MKHYSAADKLQFQGVGAISVAIPEIISAWIVVVVHI